MVITNMKELEFFPPETDTNAVVNALTNALLNSTEGGSASSLNFTRLNQNLEGISDKLPVRLPPFYTLIIRSLTILEGLAVFVDPSFRLIRGAYPFIARQILTNPSPEMNRLLQSLIVTTEGRIRWDKLEQFISISANADAAVSVFVIYIRYLSTFPFIHTFIIIMDFYNVMIRWKEISKRSK